MRARQSSHRGPTRHTRDIARTGVSLLLLALVLGAGVDAPGPLVTHFAGVSGELPCPLFVVPGGLSEDEIDRLS